MQRTEVMTRLRQYFAQDVLGGRDIGLDETTPLLEWGVINSLEIVRLLAFVQTHYGIEIPIYQLTADRFTNLSTVTDLVMESAGVTTP